MPVTGTVLNKGDAVTYLYEHKRYRGTVAEVTLTTPIWSWTRHVYIDRDGPDNLRDLVPVDLVQKIDRDRKVTLSLDLQVFVDVEDTPAGPRVTAARVLTPIDDLQQSDVVEAFNADHEVVDVERLDWLDLAVVGHDQWADPTWEA